MQFPPAERCARVDAVMETTQRGRVWFLFALNDHAEPISDCHGGRRIVEDYSVTIVPE